MRPIRLDALAAEQRRDFNGLHHATRDVRVRTRAQTVLLAAERRPVAAEIAPIVRQDGETVRRWFARYFGRPGCGCLAFDACSSARTRGVVRAEP